MTDRNTYFLLLLLTLFVCVIECHLASSKPSLEMENEEKIRLEARRRLEEQLKQYRVQRHKERVSSVPVSFEHLKFGLRSFKVFLVVSNIYLP